MNLYAHFPFCRRKCAYCALYSRVGVSQADRDAYVASLAEEIARDGARAAGQIGAGTNYSTIYFGGGSPALCDLRPLFSALQNAARPESAPYPGVGIALRAIRSDYEFTVELHPLDVSEERLEMLKAGGVNRISMGVQSFDDQTLAVMGRGYTIDEALRAFELVKRYFDNAGIDLIIGFPGDPCRFELKRFADLGLRHCSVYSLQNERGLSDVPDDNVVLDRIRDAAEELKAIGLERYEISNYAVPGYECRHNLAVWRGEDYVGLGEGACGRVGQNRTRGVRRGSGVAYETETLTPEEDLKERTIFRLRTREGLDASRFPEWRETLDRFVAEGLLTKSSADQFGGAVGVRALPKCGVPPPGRDRTPGDSHTDVYFLTERGTEVCDAILAEIV